MGNSLPSEYYDAFYYDVDLNCSIHKKHSTYLECHYFAICKYTGYLIKGERQGWGITKHYSLRKLETTEIGFYKNDCIIGKYLLIDDDETIYVDYDIFFTASPTTIKAFNYGHYGQRIISDLTKKTTVKSWNLSDKNIGFLTAEEIFNVEDWNKYSQMLSSPEIYKQAVINSS